MHVPCALLSHPRQIFPPCMQNNCTDVHVHHFVCVLLCLLCEHVDKPTVHTGSAAHVEAMKACMAAMPCSFSACGSFPSPCPLQRSSASSWHMPAPWTAAKGAAPHVIQRTANRGQQRRSAQIAAAGLRRVDRNFQLIPSPAGNTNELTEDCGSASGGNGGGQPGPAR